MQKVRQSLHARQQPEETLGQGGDTGLLSQQGERKEGEASSVMLNGMYVGPCVNVIM